MSRVLLFALAAAAVFLCACGLSPESQAAIAVVREMAAQGRVTGPQADALVKALESANSYPIETILGSVTAALVAHFSVMIRRGPQERELRLAARRARED